MGLAVALAVVGCGGSPRPHKVAVAAESSARPGPRDLVLEAPEALAVTVPRPRAVAGWPALPATWAVAEDNLNRLRHRAARKRATEVELRNFALALLQRAATQTDPNGTAAAELRKEAQETMDRFSGRPAAELEPATLELWSYVLATAGRYDAAAKRLVALRERQALSPFGQALDATVLLRGGLVADAEPLFSILLTEDRNPFFPYARAWLRFRRGDLRGGYLDLVAAAKSWGEKAPTGLNNELAMMAAYARVPVAEAAAAVKLLPSEGSENIRALATEYRRAGEYRLALETLALLGDADKVYLAMRMRRRSDLHYRLAEPGPAARQLIEAMHRAAECTSSEPRCAELAPKLLERAIDMASFFHTVYQTTQDAAYFDATRQLYDALGDKARTDIGQRQRDLERYKVGADPSAGVHAPEVMIPFVQARVDAVEGCYRVGLAVDPDLGGTIEMTWAIDASGSVTGVASNPAPGEQGLAAVAGCIALRSRSWRYPSRVVPGETRLTVRYELAPAEE